MRRRHDPGQAMVEFLLIAAALALALFYPFLNGDSVATALLRTLMAVLRARSFVISVL